MRSTICLFTIASAISLSTHAASIEITEQGESLSITLDGAPLPGASVTPQTGPTESWRVVLPDGYAFTPSTSRYVVGEPAGETGVNTVVVDPAIFIPPHDNVLGEVILPNGLTWNSDVPPLLTSGELANLSNPRTISGGASDPNGTPLDLVLADLPVTTSTPDGGSSFALLSLSLLCVAAFGRNSTKRL